MDVFKSAGGVIVLVSPSILGICNGDGFIVSNLLLDKVYLC